MSAVVPVTVTAGDKIESLGKWASARCLSADPPRLFHNLRASRETELVREHPIHVICSWIGKSFDVAKRHYLQVTVADFEEATSNPTSQMHADGRTSPQPEKKTAVTPAIADHTAVLIPSTGIEPVTFSSGG